MKELLQAISKHSMERFLEIKNGIPYYITTGKVIPAHCIRMPQRDDWNDGFYSLDPYICNGSHGCRVGKPATRCVAMGIVNPNQCGKYTVDQIRNHHLDTNQLCHIMIAFMENISRSAQSQAYLN